MDDDLWSIPGALIDISGIPDRVRHSGRRRSLPPPPEHVLPPLTGLVSPLLLFNGTLNDLPWTAVLLFSDSRFRADKCRAACSDSRSVTDLCGPEPRSG